jgi:parallel beta-helix repeat protein
MARSLAVAVSVLLLLSGLGWAGLTSAGPERETGIPSAGPYGVVTIESDGAISNPAAPISQSGNVYTLSGPLNGSLVVLRDGAVVNGSGYVVNYTTAGGGNPDRSAVTVNSTGSVTIEDLSTANDTWGIRANNAGGLALVYDRPSGSEQAVNISNSSDVTVTRTAVVPGPGVALFDDQDATISSSGLNGTSTGLQVFGGSNITLEKNWVVGYTSYYAIELQHVSNASVLSNDAPGPGGGIAAEFSSGVTISFNDVSESPSGYGVGFDYVSGFTADGNIAHDDGAAIWVEFSSGGTIAQDNASLSAVYGVLVFHSTSISVRDNNLSHSDQYALFAQYSSDIVASDNYGPDSPQGFEVDSCSDCSLDDNNASHANYGVVADDSPAAVLTGNQAYDTEYGVWDNFSIGAEISYNRAIGDLDGIDVAYSSDVLIEDNNASDATDTCIVLGATTNASVLDNIGSHCTVGGVYAGDMLGTTLVSGNTLVDDDPSGDPNVAGVNFAIDTGSMTASDNNVSSSVGTGIASEYNTGSVRIEGNVAQDGRWGVYLNHDSSVDEVVGNELQHSQVDSIYVNRSMEPLEIEQNNASNSNVSLYVTLCDFVSDNAIIGNDFSDSNLTNVSDSDLGGGFESNDLLHVRNTTFYDDDLADVYHNNFDSAGFYSYLSPILSGSWNAPYPVGGNYWTGYDGIDRFSGPGQDLPGSDGIGDTPYAISGITDDYPLMKPWANAVVAFSELGLPVGEPWSVSLNGATESSVGGATVDFDQGNGAYTAFNYSVSPPAGYSATPAAGTGVETGANATIPIVFAPITYNVTLTETGLPAGTTWGVEIEGKWANSTSSSFNVTEPNGTYSFSVALEKGFTTAPSSGSLAVDGTSTSIAVAYSPVRYAVDFIATNLPTGMEWQVTLAGNAISSPGGEISFTETSGTYGYVVSGPSGYTLTPSNATVTVSASNTTVYIAVSVVESSPPATSGSSPLLLGALLAAVVLAIVGWALLIRRRSTPGERPLPPSPIGPGPGSPPNSPPPGAMGPPPSS